MITEILIGTTFVIWIVWTVIAQRYGNKTISRALRDTMWDFTTLSLIWGILLGHWSGTYFWPVIGGVFGYTVPFIVASVIHDVLWLSFNGWGARSGYRWPVWYYLIGMGVGLAFWGIVTGKLNRTV